MDMWTNLSAPVVSARADLDREHAGTEITAGFGNGSRCRFPADLFFREGNGVRLNPNLRPERVRWEIDAGVRQELGVLAGAELSVRAFKGRVGDMVLWGLSPAYGFVWTPQNFDVRRQGGEAGLSVRPFTKLTVTASGTYRIGDRDVPNGSRCCIARSAPPRQGSSGNRGPWSSTRAGTTSGSATPTASASIRSRRSVSRRRDRAPYHSVPSSCRSPRHIDRRAEFVAGFPSPGRSFTLTLNAGTP
jgi:hypothetical protein